MSVHFGVALHRHPKSKPEVPLPGSVLVSDGLADSLCRTMAKGAGLTTSEYIRCLFLLPNT